MSMQIAIIGMAFRLPGTTTPRYWDDLLAGKNLVSRIDASRWSLDAYLHPDKQHPGTSYTFAAGSLGDVSGFDADFFGISPREAALMDPQQRLLLELCWETIESAGLKPASLRGSSCGVYVGISSADYSYRMADDPRVVGSHSGTGNTASIAANRLSYVFDLHGPSMAVDTACSSSLVAFHQACRAIASGEIDSAIAGGVHLLLHPLGFLGFSKASMLSPTGQCRVFDAAANGYVRSEGGGLFLLKDHARAVADGDPILAVVAGSAVNTDGRKAGLTIPNADAQIALMRQAYEQAGIEPGQIHYLEAHGTGTPVGDPIETHAIGHALGQPRGAGAPLPIGSVKSNMGHLETASGVAGLVKALHSLRHRVVPATIGVETVNPNIHCDDWNLRIVTEPLPLPASGTLTIGVNSFGFGGANAHVILQTPPQPDSAPGSQLIAMRPLPLVVSGRTPAALRAAARDMAQLLRDTPARALYDVACQAATRREWHDHRAVVFGADGAALAGLLEQLAGDETPAAPLATGKRVPAAQGPVFAYSGNGSQWPGMGAALLGDLAFAKTVAEIDEHFVPLAGWSIASLLERAQASDAYADTEIAQPALFAVQAGMTRMLAQHGVQPTAVLGHSVGEVSAAWACGALTLADAVTVIYHRSQLQGRTRGQGRMAAIGLDGAAATALLTELNVRHDVCVAGYNSAAGATLAGHLLALERVGKTLAERHVFYKLLDLDYAFHSDAMDGLQPDLMRSLKDIRPRETRIPFYSTVTGARLDGRALDADYWWRNIRQPVRFEQALSALTGRGENVHVEIGPAPVLRAYLDSALKQADTEGLVVTTGQRGNTDTDRMLAAAGQVLISGAQPDWAAIFPWRGRHVELPAYPWQRERHWHPVTAESLGLLERRAVHPLLGYPLSQQAQRTWENQLDTQRHPWLADHVVGDAILFPGAGFAEMALAAARQWQGGDHLDVADLEFHLPLLLAAAPESGPHARHSVSSLPPEGAFSALGRPGGEKITRLTIDESDGRFRLLGNDPDSDTAWTRHASGRLLSGANGQWAAQTPPPLPRRRPDFNGPAHLALTGAAGLTYGPAFQSVSHGWIESPTSLLAVLKPSEALADTLTTHLLHPALLDCAFQLPVHLLKDDAEAAAAAGIAFVPARIGRLRWRAGLGLPRRVRARLLKRAPHSLTFEFALFDDQGRQIAAVDEARFRAVRLSKAQADPLLFLDYAAVPSPHPRANAGAHTDLCGRVLRAALQPVVSAIQTDGLLDRYTREVEPLLESLCDRYAAQALRALSKQDCFSAETLAACRQAAPQAAPFLDHLLDRAARPLDQSLDWQVIAASADEPETIDIWNSLLSDYPDYFPIIHAVGRVGLRLQDLLQGRAELSATLPQGATPATLLANALGAGAQQRLLDTLRERLTQALRTRKPGQRLGVLEVGAGAPACAPALCAELDFSVADYGYASADGAALEQAGHLREHFPALQTHAIGADADAPPIRWADLVLFHCRFATHGDAEQALRYAAARLKPGGTLLLHGTQPATWMDFVFGAQAAWWNESADGERRLSPQYPADTWRALLSGQGLECAAPLEFAPDMFSGAYLLTASLPANARIAESAPPPNGGWLILADAPAGDAPSPAELAKHLSDAHRVAVEVGDLAATENLDTVLTQARLKLGGIRGIVLMPSLPPGSRRESPLPRHSRESGNDEGMGFATPSPGEGLQLMAQVGRCARVASLAQACERTALPVTLWLLTRGAAPFMPADPDANLNDASLWLYGRTLANEASGFSVRLVDLPAGGTPLEALARELLWPDAEQEIALGPKGERHAPRLRKNPRPAVLPPLPEEVVAKAPLPRHSRESGNPSGRSDRREIDTLMDSRFRGNDDRIGFATPSKEAREKTPVQAETQALQLGFDLPGQLRNLHWKAVDRPAPGADQLEVRVQATGLNFRDVMYALGLLSDEAVENGYAGPTLGLEFAGIVERVGSGVIGYQPGDAVVGFGPASFGTHMLAEANALAHLPAGLSMEAGATIPSTFFTVYYALHHLARLEAGESILIHGAAGGVGIAAIQYAQWLGAEIHATAGSDEKRDFLRLMGVEHIYDSRSLDFADQILARTEGRGVDVVLNSLAGEAITRNLGVLKPFGRFLELGKRDFYENTRIGLRPFRNNISYFGIDADQLMAERPALTRRLFGEMMALFEQGALHPLPYQTFDANEVVDAFRHMQQARQIGKIVITYHRPLAAAAPALAPQPRARLNLPADASYLVTGGLSGFGLRTALWLADKGARHLALISRGGPASDEARQALAGLRERGVRVHAAACDVTDRQAVAALLAHIGAEMPPLRGIVHAAMMIDDGLIRNATPAQIERVMAPKILGAAHLDELTRESPLDFFVLHSSATTLFGNPGQSGYVAANGWLEALARRRRARGLPATSPRWGAIADAGFLARNGKILDALQSRMGGAALPAARALDALEDMLLANAADLGVLELDWRALARFLPGAVAPQYAWMARDADTGKQDNEGAGDIAQLLATLSDDELHPRVTDMLRHEVAEILRLPADKIDPHRSVYDMGLDSLMGVELSVALESRFGVRLPVMALSENPTLSKLAARLIETLRARNGGAAEPDATTHQIAQLAAQHAEGVSQEVIDEFAASLHNEARTPAQRLIQ